MFKFFVLFVALFVCSRASYVASFEFGCGLHYHLTSPDYECEAYQMFLNNNVVNSLLYYTYPNNPTYYQMAYVDLEDYSKEYKVFFVSNASGECETFNQNLELNLYPTFDYDYSGFVDCPPHTNSTSCMKYCTDYDFCIIADSKRRPISIFETTHPEAGTNITYFDDVPTVDMFSIKCGNDEYTGVDFCAAPKKVDLTLKCSGRIRETLGENSMDVYYMMHGKDAAYLRSDISVNGGSYYRITVVDKHLGNRATILSNETGECETTMDSFMSPLLTEFEYYADPKTVDCPGGATDCKEYCNYVFIGSYEIIKQCIVVNSSSRMVEQRISGQIVDFEYFDDDVPPSVDMFSVECEGEQFTAFDTCEASEKMFTPNLTCSGHIFVQSESGSFWFDNVYMLEGKDVAYLRFTTTAQGENVTGYLYYDLERKDGSAFMSWNGSTCVNTHASAETLFYELVPLVTKFAFTEEPVPSVCPDGSDGCSVYYNNYTEDKILVDSNLRIAAETIDGIPMLVKYYDDVVTLDDFKSPCGGYDTLKDYCVDTSSSSHGSSPSSPSSSTSPSSPSTPSTPINPSSSSMMKAGVAVVAGSVLLALI